MLPRLCWYSLQSTDDSGVRVIENTSYIRMALYELENYSNCRKCLEDFIQKLILQNTQIVNFCTY